MTQKMYFLAEDKTDHEDLWVTDGTTTTAVGGLADIGVANVGNEGLGPEYLTPFGQGILFAGGDSLDDAASNGVWQSDGTAGGTKEVGGASPGPGKSSPFVGGNPSGLNPTNFVVFGSKALFVGLDASNFDGLWVTDGTTSGTIELGGLQNGQIVGKGAAFSPLNFAAFNNVVLFDADDASGFQGLWETDGTTAGTVEIGGMENTAVYDSGLSNFIANNFITLGDLALFSAPNKDGDNALWVTDGSALNTFELGGVDNAGIPGGDAKVGLGSGLANAVRFGARVFFLGPDDSGDAGLWTTDGTALGTQEVGGLGDAGLTNYGQHPSSLGLGPTDLTDIGQKVLFNGEDALSFQELWVSDGSALGTYEIGGEGVGGALAHEAVNGLNPYSIVSLGNGKAVFIGYDDSNDQNSGKPTLWVTDGTYAGTQEIGGLDNQGVANIDASGFDFTDDLVGGSGLAYFVGQDAAGDFVLWKTDGTVGGTKVVAATDGAAPTTGLDPTYMTMAAPPATATDFSGGGETINLNNVPGETVDISNTGNVADTVSGSNGLVNLSGAQAAIIGGGVAVVMSGVGCAVSLSNTAGNKDSVFGSKGAVTLNGAQANVIGGKNAITFATGTTGDVVYLSNTNKLWDTVTGSNGTVYLTSAQVSVTGDGDKIYFAGGSDDQVSIYSTNVWDTVTGSGGVVILNDAQASVFGGYDIVDETAGSSASLYNTSGHWDTVNATSATVILNGAQASVTGGGNTIYETAGSTVSLYGTSNNWDLVNASSAYVLLTGAQAAIVGGGDVVTANAGSQASFSGTKGVWDSFAGSSDTVILTGAQVSVTGGGDTVYADSASTASLYGTSGNWDNVQSSGAAIYLTNAQALVTGGGDFIYETGASSSVSLKGTAGKWDTLTGSGEVDIVTSAQVSIVGGGDVIWASGGSSVSLYSTQGAWDTVNGASETVYLTSAQASVVGGGEAIYASGASSVSLYSTNDVADAVSGSGETVYLTSAQASIAGGGDVIYASGASTVGLSGTNNVWDTFNGSGQTVQLTGAQASIVGAGNQIAASNGSSMSLYGSGDAVTASGSVVTLVNSQDSLTGTGDIVYFSGADALSANGGQDAFYVAKAFGLSSIGGFQMSDVVHLSAQDWTSFQALKLSGDLQQIGSNTVIALDANDKLTLAGVTAANLTSAQFLFA